MRLFKALKTFDVAELKSTYVEGLVYTIDDNNKILNALAEVWAIQGNIEFVHDKSTYASMKGTGYVEPTFWDLTKAGWRSLWR